MNAAEPIQLIAHTTVPRLRPLDAAEFMTLQLPDRQLILAPWLPEKGLAMIVAPRGIGKTHFAMSVAYAVACGAPFLKFSAIQPRRVLYLDGEMPARAMQERFAAIVQASEQQPPSPDYFKFLAADLSENGLPDLSTVEGRLEIDDHIGNAELIVLDNLSTLVRGGKENEAESWTPIQEWALTHRRAGRTILMIHHAGKNGGQRGTSKREDVLDSVLSLKRPQDYCTDQGARFEIHFDKARGFYGDEAQPFEAQYEVREGQAVWSFKAMADVDLMRMVEALNSGLGIREAGRDCGFSKSKAQRLKDRAVTEGLLDAK